MSHAEGVVLSIELSLMLIIGLVFGQIAQRAKLPAVFGELLGGILLGPTGLGRIAPPLFVDLFPRTGNTAIGRQAFIQVGLVCFLFAAGLEMGVPKLRELGRKIFWTSTLGILVPFACGFLIVYASDSGWSDHIHLSRGASGFFLGTALGISALPVIARILMDLGLVRHELGSVVLTSATLNDLVGWSLFAAILGTFAPSGASQHNAGVVLLSIFAFAALLLTVGRALVKRARPWVRARVTSPGGLIGLASVVWLAAAALAEWIGVHAVIGAFLVGLMLAEENEQRSSSAEAVHQFTMGVFAPIYFVSVGLRTDFGAHFDLSLVALVLVVACVGKIVGATLGARLGSMSWREALAVGFGLNARGAMEMILASIALEHQLIDEKLFVALVVMALVTSLLSGPVMHRLLHPTAVADSRSVA